MKEPLAEEERIPDSTDMDTSMETEKTTNIAETGTEAEAILPAEGEVVSVPAEVVEEVEAEGEVAPVGGEEEAEEREEAEELTETEAAVKEAMEAIAQQLISAKQEAEEYKDKWLRAAAEFANVRKRNERIMAEAIAHANARLIRQLLPIVDDFELAFQNVPEDLNEAEARWVEGFRLIQRKLEQLLAAEGVTPIEAEGQQFDPFLHEAIAHEEAEDYEDGQIIAEVRKGYKLGERVLRPSLVRVAK